MSLMSPNMTTRNHYILITGNWSTGEKIVALLFTLCVNLSALVLNLLLVATIMFSKSLRKQPDSILIGNLAMADFLVACCIMPFTSFSLIQDEIDVKNGLWTFVGFANFLFCIASIINLAIMSLDQCLNITYPFWYHVRRTRSTAFIMAACVWVYSGMCGLPPLFGISSYACFIPNTGPCSVDQWSGKNYSVIFVVVVTSASWGFGVLLLFMSNIVIYLVAVKQSAAIKTTMVHKESCPKGKRNLSSLHQSYTAQQSYHSFTTNDFYDKATNATNTSVSGESNGHANETCRISTGADLTNPNSLRPGTVSFTHINNAEASNLSDPHSKSIHFAPILPNVTKVGRRRGKLRASKSTPPRCNCFPSKKHVKSLLIIVSAYFVSWTPFCSLLLIEIQQQAKQHSDLSLVFLWIGHVSSFINPALYFYRYNRLRQEAKTLCSTIFLKIRVNPS